MLYLQRFIFPNERQEAKFLYPKDKTPGEVSSGAFKDFRARTHHGSIYPFGILDQNRLGCVSFDRITIFCGGNGCGKTTALNVIAEKLGLKRDSMFNSGRFFQEYLDMCKFDADLGTDRYVRKQLGKEVELYLPNDSTTLMCAYENNVESILIPLFGGGCGEVHPKVIAEMMWKAYDQIHNPPKKLDWYYVDAHEI